jgi:hypothetical protein
MNPKSAKSIEEKPGVRVLELEKPLSFGEEKITRLEFVPLLTRHLKELPLGSTLTWGDLLGIASKSSGLPLKVLEGLEVADGLKVMETVASFLGHSLSTGENV